MNWLIPFSMMTALLMASPAQARQGGPIDGVTYLQAIAAARADFRAALKTAEAEINADKKNQVDELRSGHKEQMAQAADRLERAALCQVYYARKKEIESAAAQQIAERQKELQQKLDEKLLEIRKRYGVRK